MSNNKEWKIYTRQGDKGETSLLGGSRVPKYHNKIEAYGTLDELNAFIGLLRDQKEVEADMQEFLYEVQEKIFAAESLVAADSEDNLHELPEINEEDISKLEKAIDEMNLDLPELKNFILPGGHPVVSYAHVARTVCRRAERLVIRTGEEYPVDEKIIRYLNRLSDFFFVLGRYFSHTFDIPEDKWTPGKV